MRDQVEPQPQGHRQHHAPRSPHGSVRDVTVVCASAGVLALLVFYALAAPTAKLKASIGSVVPRPGSTAVVRGRVLEPNGGGLDGARIVVRRSGRTIGAAVSDDAGTFRVDLSGRCAVYDISVRAHAFGSTVETAARRQLCPGDALPMDVRMITQGHFLWIPGPR
jgi:hypothetical protein